MSKQALLSKIKTDLFKLNKQYYKNIGSKIARTLIRNQIADNWIQYCRVLQI